MGKGGDAVGTKRVDGAYPAQRDTPELPPLSSQGRSTDSAREALKFFFSDEGKAFGIDCCMHLIEMYVSAV